MKNVSFLRYAKSVQREKLNFDIDKSLQDFYDDLLMQAKMMTKLGTVRSPIMKKKDFIKKAKEINEDVEWLNRLTGGILS